MKALATALLALAGLLLAGCSGPGTGGSTPDTDDQGRYVIHMTSGNQFRPARAEVPANATVVWVHDGGAPHDVTSEDGTFSSGSPGSLTQGEEFAHTFREPGTYEYVCKVHEGSGMRGTIVVE